MFVWNYEVNMYIIENKSISRQKGARMQPHLSDFLTAFDRKLDRPGSSITNV